MAAPNSNPPVNFAQQLYLLQVATLQLQQAAGIKTGLIVPSAQLKNIGQPAPATGASLDQDANVNQP
jgi:hypothetical protein